MAKYLGVKFGIYEGREIVLSILKAIPYLTLPQSQYPVVTVNKEKHLFMVLVPRQDHKMLIKQSRLGGLFLLTKGRNAKLGATKTNHPIIQDSNLSNAWPFCVQTFSIFQCCS